MGSNVTDVGYPVTTLGYQKEKKNELKKHAATIHCSNTLSLLQRKITNALLYHAYNELMLKDEHEITVKQLCRLIGYQGNNHAAIKEALKGLISTIIEWNLIDEVTGSENWTASSIIASVSLEGPLCYYAYSPRMKQLLHTPSIFGKIDLVIQSHFRSSYGLALYENCIRYRGLPQTKWFHIDLFKKLMGVPFGKYTIFRDFKRRVLDKAVEEVNTYSDLVVEAECIREGKKVTKIRFHLRERAKKKRLGGKEDKKTKTSADAKASPLLAKLQRDFSLGEEQITQLLQEFDAAFIWDKISIIEASKAFQENKIKNLAAYLLSALKHDYQVNVAKPKRAVSATTQLKLEIDELKQQVEAIRLAYNRYREKKIHEAIDLLIEPQKKKFLDAFFRTAKPLMTSILHLQRSKYTQDNILDSPQVKASLRQFAIRELDSLQYLSFEEFVLKLDAKKREAWQRLKSYDPDHPLLRLASPA